MEVEVIDLLVKNVFVNLISDNNVKYNGEFKQLNRFNENCIYALLAPNPDKNNIQEFEYDEKYDKLTDAIRYRLIKETFNYKYYNNII